MAFSGDRVEQAKQYFIESMNNDRSNSWLYCHTAFLNASKNRRRDGLLSLHLAGYLASWGMYTRKSKMMTENSYMVHKDLIPILLDKNYNSLFEISNFESFSAQYDNVKEIYNAIVEYYSDNISTTFSPSDALITKIMLGVYGCIPALDTNVKKSLRSSTEFKCQTVNTYIKALFEVIENNADLNNAIIEIKRMFPDLTYMRIIDGLLWSDGKRKSSSNET